MFSRIHGKLGTAGLIVAVVALVAALGGGAYAANNGLNKQQKKQVRNIAKNSTKGPIKNESKKWSKKFSKRFAEPGPAGPQGLPGATGLPGPQGAPGATGAPGADGTDGSNGAKGATGDEGPKGPTGDEGATGPTGTFGSEPLPSGETLTGTWVLPEGAYSVTQISFPIPLPAPIAGSENVELLAVGEEGGENCTGGTVADPKADPGFICLYTAYGTMKNPSTGAGKLIRSDVSPLGGGGASEMGAVFAGEEVEDEFELGYTYGTWAVATP